MNLIELDRALQTTSSGRNGRRAGNPSAPGAGRTAAPIDLLSCLVSDELALSWRSPAGARKKQAQFRDSQKTLDNFDFTFNNKMNRSLVFDLATGAFIARHEDALFLGPPDPDTCCYTSLNC